MLRRRPSFPAQFSRFTCFKMFKAYINRMNHINRHTKILKILMNLDESWPKGPGNLQRFDKFATRDLRPLRCRMPPPQISSETWAARRCAKHGWCTGWMWQATFQNGSHGRRYILICFDMFLICFDIFLIYF